MPVNLLAPLGARYGPQTLADAQRAATQRGFRLVRSDVPDERLGAWIDWTFAPSWWSSEVRDGAVWYALRADEIVGFAGFGARSRRAHWLRRYRGRPDVAVFGPYGVAPAWRGTGIGAALLTAALCGCAERAPSALIPAVAGDRLIALYEGGAQARVVDEYDYELPPARTVMLASGSGTNVQAVIDARAAGRIGLELAAVVTNVETAPVFARAHRSGIPAEAVVWQRGSESRAAYDRRVIDVVARLEPELVLLLGWMHVLPPAFLERFPQTLNVHPAFLPFDPTCDEVVCPDGTTLAAFRGARAVAATVAAGARWSGATVHTVRAEFDRGEIVVRTPLCVEGRPSADELAARIHPLEHAALIAALRRWGFERDG